MTNRLATETSPYLRQHKDNPVDWFGWGSEAFDLARQRNVPVLLSVGYSACHWCHVMAHECFEDDETANLMNQLFVNIKVDREERPDIDALYMDAVQAMSGRGGWPMTVFMTPDGRPFFGGTYFPKPSFIQLMNAINDAWHNRRDDIENNIAALVESLGRTARITPDATLPTIDLFTHAVSELGQTFDQRWGGFGGAPKFPSTMNLDLLVRSYLNDGSPTTRNILTTTLDAMASGGMYDHLGGGFSRYSVDEKWLVPHFEKMLYDQALLVRVYTHAAVVFNEPKWRQVVEETVEYLLRDLRHENGGFFSAQDADSLDDQGHSHEGYFYVFTPSQVREILPADLVETALEWYEITESGNFEGSNIPVRLNHRGLFKRTPEVDKIRSLLLKARSSRTWPLLDDKVLTEWNAMMTASLVEAAVLFERPDWLDAAQRNGEFMLRELRDENGRWLRSWQESGVPQARHRALASDLANLIDAFTRLGEATGKSSWITHAQNVADQLLENYWDPKNSGLYTIANDAEQLIVRQKDLLDNATPSANSTAALSLIRLGALTGSSKYNQAALDIMRFFHGLPPAHQVRLLIY
ncbi:uncharacterized protein YyaL [Acidimicrobiaceae bacterium]|nr:uncharacterized protein YyaL [Acidimicrobiaceae bacterium]